MKFSEVLDFWLGSPQSRQRGRHRQEWFRKNPAFDADIRDRFLALHASGIRGELSDWEKTPLASLALVILLDQFSRNMFRDDSAAFAADPVALGVSRRMVERGFDRLLQPIERCFVYLPFEHSEDLAAQRRSIALFEGLRFSSDCAGNIEYAYKHYDVIVRFGRFPHRNAVLGRVSSPQEAAYLAQPGAGF